MKRSRVRLADVLEWGAAVAVGLAASWWLAGSLLEFDMYVDSISDRYREILFSILAGIAVVEGIALAWEMVRRRGPARWGPGRWVWATAGLFLLIVGALNLVNAVTPHNQGFIVVGGQTVRSWSSAGMKAEAVLHRSLPRTIDALSVLFPVILLVIGLMYGCAGRLRDPHPDLRERAGQFYAVLFIGEVLIYYALVIVGA